MRVFLWAEGAGFEPAKGVNPYPLSKRAPSTTQPPLQMALGRSQHTTESAHFARLRTDGAAHLPAVRVVHATPFGIKAHAHQTR